MDDATQELREFAYIVSHDFSAPLRAMVEFSRLLKAEPPEGLGEEQALYLSLIVENGEKMQKMMAGLLEYSRINTQAQPHSEVDLNHVLEECKSRQHVKIRNSGAAIEAGKLPVISADPIQMSQLMNILLSNALTFHDAATPPHVWVSAQKSPEGWVVTVRDDGIGIEGDYHKRVFQPFQRLHTEGEYPGIGMGLALARKIVERHGGRLWVDSRLGEGASFIFVLPA